MKVNYSLLWADYNNKEEDKNIIPEYVFNDLKIEKFLSSQLENYDDVYDIMKVMSIMPEKIDIEYRSDIFEDFLNDKDDILSNIYYKLHNLQDRYILYKNSVKNIYRYVYFLIYTRYYYLFIIEIRDLFKHVNIGSKAIKSIIDYCEDFATGKEELIIEINRLYDNLMSILSFSALVKEGSPYIEIDKTKEDNLYDKLVKIANNLKIELVKNPRLSSRKEIDSSYLYSIASSNKALFDSIKDFYEKNNYLYDLDFKDLLKELKYYLNMKFIFTNMNKQSIPICKCMIGDKTSIINACDVSLTVSKIKVIGNDYSFIDDSYMHFILGVNSGGKTCFLRSVGINYLFFCALGYMFCEKATVLPLKFIYTHFPNEENYKIGEGRLLDELARIKIMKKNFSNETLVLFNETFSSTNEDKACTLTKELLKDILETKTKAIFVTHQYKVFDEIKDEGVSFFTPCVDNDTKRTYKIKKVEKNLLSYAYDILYKYGLTKKQLEQARRKKHE